MKKYVLILLLLFVAVVAWRIGEKLSSDAISMGLGVFLGILAGIPTAILVMAGNRRRAPEADGPRPRNRQASPPYPQQFAPQPPVIVLTGHGPGTPQINQTGAYPAYGSPADQDWMQRTPTERRFKVVGEKEEWIDEW